MRVRVYHGQNEISPRVLKRLTHMAFIGSFEISEHPIVMRFCEFTEIKLAGELR